MSFSSRIILIFAIIYSLFSCGSSNNDSGQASGSSTSPIVTTNAASAITESGATLNATVNPNGLSTTGQFEYGLDTTYGQTISPAGSLGSGTVAVSMTATVSGLTCGTTYHFRAIASNAGGSSSGLDSTFVTSACTLNASLTGNYFVAGHQLDITSGTTTEIWSWTGVVNFDGNGICSYTGTNEVGAKRITETTTPSVQVFIGTPDSNSCTYNLAMDNTLKINGSSYYVSADLNSIIGIYSISTIETAVKLGSENLTNSSLNGDYWFSAQSNIFSTTSIEDNAVHASVSFDGNGNCAYSESSNISGKRTENVTPRTIESIQNTPTNMACTYDLAADGTLTINGKATYGVSADTNTIIGIDYYSPTDIAAASYVALVKKSGAALDNSSIQGKYADLWLMLELYPDTTEAWTWGGETTFDGNGNCSYQGNYLEGFSRDDTVDPRIIDQISVTPISAACTYDLAADGTLTIHSTSENETYTYYVNPNANSIIGLQIQDRRPSFVTTFFSRLVRLAN